jgi:hypothetical protein
MADFPASLRSRTLSLLLAASIALVLATSGQANAQSASASPSPGADQYGPSVDASAADIPPALIRNTAGGADSVNDAMTAGTASPSAAQIESLPETGGSPLASLCAGASFLGCALLILRSNLRKS